MHRSFLIILGALSILFFFGIEKSWAQSIEISPEDMTFPNTRVGETSVAETFTVERIGVKSVTIELVMGTDEFHFPIISDNCTGKTLNNQTEDCTIDVAFEPSTTANFSAALTVVINQTLGQITHAQIHGVGVAPQVGLSDTNVNFGDQTVGDSGVPFAVTLTNTGTATLNISDISVTGEFDIDDDCDVPIEIDEDCFIDITFLPTSTGTKTGTLTISDDATDSPQTISLNGVGVSPVNPDIHISVNNITFGNQEVNTESSEKTVTITNIGTVDVEISGITIEGDFSQTNNCPATLGADDNCNINVVFEPTTPGILTGTLTITSNATDNPHEVGLEGIGTLPDNPNVNLSASNEDFGNQSVGTTSAAQTITITNTGTSDLTIERSEFDGDDTHSFSKIDRCHGLIIPVGSSCTIDISFTPAFNETFSVTLQIFDDAGNSPQTVTITGVGLTLAATGGCSLGGENGWKSFFLFFIFPILPFLARRMKRT